MTLRVVQIGLGGWGRNWVEEVTRDTQGVEPVAWVDLDPATRDAPWSIAACAASGCSARSSRRWSRSRPTRRSWSCRLRRMRRSPAPRSRPACTSWSRSRSPRRSNRPARWNAWRTTKRVLMVSQNYRWFPAPVLARRLLHRRHARPSGRLLPRLPLLLRHRLPLLFSRRAAAQRYADPSLRYLALRARRRAGRSELSQLGGARHAVRGSPAAVAAMRFANGVVVSYAAAG